MLARKYVSPRLIRIVAVAGCTVLALSSQRAAYSQGGGGFGQNQAVGGVAIDASGQLRNAERDETRRLHDLMRGAIREAAGELKGKTELRKVSLRRLETAIADLKKINAPLTDDIRFLAGLQRIQYVFVYPEAGDIVLAGPAEGWKLDGGGNVVGQSTGWPVMMLDDLLVALRSSESTQAGISCSIDPTPEGLAKLQQFAKSLKAGGNLQDAVGSIESVLGQQVISVKGVPATSHFARVLVVADYKMKRLAMNFDEAPVKNMPSFLSLMKAGPAGMQNMLPRWWLEPDYDALLADPAGLAWELRGAGVRTVTEEDFLNADGSRQQTGKANLVAKKWADSMTARYDELAAHEPVFGQLRNCIDLAVVAALISKEHLTERANHSFPLLLNDDQLPSDRFNAPNQVASKASVMKKGQNWLISASGGVLINPWELSKSQPSAELAPVRAKAVASGAGWWWN